MSTFMVIDIAELSMSHRKMTSPRQEAETQLGNYFAYVAWFERHRQIVDL
jgi:hypothetical protein